jgi:predicted DNA-binding helix-hairpin-helix protein
MRFSMVPDTYQKLLALGAATAFEPAGDAPHQEQTGRYQSRSLAECITHVSTAQGKKPLLKTMVTTACEKNCYYCPFRAGRGKTRRLTFQPDELAGAFAGLVQKRQVDGLFLSSGIIKGGVTTQDKLLDTVDIVRRKYAYRGYVHLKIMPGAEYDQIARALQLADRVSINLEAPTSERLALLAPKKDLDHELLQRLLWAHEIRQQQRLKTSLVTQFVVGAVGDTDLELLTLSAKLYQQAKLARTYYSAFAPVSQTPLEDVARVAPLRELRLYQASFLLRDYGWEVEELPFLAAGNLRTDIDPKQAWADQHLRVRPLEIMHASREELLRVPGFGLQAVTAILQARPERRLRDLSQLKALGIRAPEQSAPYILLSGQAPTRQLTLF